MNLLLADRVKQRADQLLAKEPEGRVVSRVRPKNGGTNDEYVVEHIVHGSTYAQFLQILLAEMCSSPIQLLVTRSPVADSDGDRWRIEQEAVDLAALYSAHVFDSLFGAVAETEVVADERWESEVRLGIGEAYPGQMRVILAHSRERGREVIIWGMPSETHARIAHEYLLQRFAELHLAAHYDLAPLARLDGRFPPGWAVSACEH